MVELPRVSSGSYNVPRITTSLTVRDGRAKDGVTDSTAAALTVATSTVKRLSGRMSLRMEDVAAVGNGRLRSGNPHESSAGGRERARCDALAERHGLKRSADRAARAAHRSDRSDAGGRFRCLCARGRGCHHGERAVGIRTPGCAHAGRSGHDGAVRNRVPGHRQLHQRGRLSAPADRRMAEQRARAGCCLDHPAGGTGAARAAGTLDRPDADVGPARNR